MRNMRHSGEVLATMSHHESHCSISEEYLESIINGIVERLRRSGMRRTGALDSLLSAMLDPHRPYSLAELCEKPGLVKRDQATVYRMINRLNDLGIVQQLSLGGRASHYQLNLPDHHHDYLYCHKCGKVREVPIPCGLHELESRLTKDYGWSRLTHSLAFHGLCPECAAAE